MRTIAESTNYLQPLKAATFQELMLVVGEWFKDEVVDRWNNEPPGAWVAKFYGQWQGVPYICNLIREETGAHTAIFFRIDPSTQRFEETMRWVIAPDEGKTMSFWLENR